MNEVLINVLPAILIFCLGIFLKKVKVFSKENGDIFLRMVFYGASPALILLSLTDVKLLPQFAYFPIIAILIIMSTFVITRLLKGFFRLLDSTYGVLLIGSMIMNTGFVFPFLIAAFGKEAVARLALFDLGIISIVFTFVYYLACKYGENKKSGVLIKRLIYSPPIWATLIGLLLNLLGIRLPGIAVNFLQLLGNLAVPLSLFSLGLYFNPYLEKVNGILPGIALRMALGLLLGIILGYLFGLKGIDRTVIILLSAAPVGYNTITFSTMENLDKEFAANLVSYANLIAIVLIPVLIFVLS